MCFSFCLARLHPTFYETYSYYLCYRFDKKPDEGLRLYESRFLVVIRAASLDEHTFIKGLCKASMKRLQYETNLKLHESGQIEETSCECVAGSGITAHCKHVAMVLYAVEHMVREKVMIKHQMPTEKLQKFHVPKKVFASTPIKTSKLSMKRNIDNIIFSPCTMKIDKEEYNKRFRSLVTNYSSSSMPMKQLYEPANPFAVEWDHCYCNVSNETKLLQSFNLISISPEEATAIELETRGQASNTKWRNHREVRITASKFHTICHLKGSSQEKFASQIINPNKFTSKATNHGIIHEKVALQQYMKETDLQVHECGLFISLERSYLAASPDGLLGDETTVEIKCPYSSRNQKITNVTVPYLVQDDEQLKLKKGTPCYYQVQGQMYCTNRKFCNVVVFTFKEIKVIFVERDDDFINEMLQKLDDFYEKILKKAILNKYIYKNYLEVIINKTVTYINVFI